MQNLQYEISVSRSLHYRLLVAFCRHKQTDKVVLRIVFTKTNGYSNEYQTVVIKLLLNRNIQNIKRK